MTEAAVLTDTYRRDFARAEREVLPTLPAWLASLRRDAMETFARLGFPGPKDEA